MGGAAAATLLVPMGLMAKPARAQVSPLLNPALQPKFVNPLPNPLAPNYIFLPTGVDAASGLPLYDISAQQIRHEAGLIDPVTGTRLSYTAWAYGTVQQPAIYPGYSFNLRSGNAVKVRYSNGLDGVTYPADVPVDQTLDWADPLNANNPANQPYTGPVPLVAHQHGGDTDFLSDGLPDAWATPGNAATGRLFNPVYTYDNSQEATQLWYHDHAVGVTRLNVYMGLAGNYFIRDANEDALQLPAYPYEVPLLIQDRTFLANGELFYDHVDPANPLAPVPTHLPENFGDTILVNGVAWPVLDVEPRKYRLRVLNGSDSRVYDMQMSNGMPWTQIGSDLGLLNAPVAQGTLSVAPGERCDVILDFARMAGQTIIVRNNAKAPYPSGAATNPKTTGQVMAFRVSLPLSGVPDRPIPANLRPISGPVPVVTNPVRTRKILLFEGTDALGRLQTMGGIVDNTRPTLNGTLTFHDPITENPQVGDTEIWEFYNTTGDAHPIHMHLVDFRVLNRQKFSGTITPKTNSDGSTGGTLDEASVKLLGKARAPGAEEAGKKDTAKMFPGEVTRVIAKFKRPGEYLFHCHILSHEDHEMMRPYYVGQIPAGR
ncbi:multicopper oxidase family protein [Ramlibacter alkalitolerans]|uniref:Multicopper oxidase domain-containing protein n=1 Tax=Ramlibacter alkalitolerans TaxID=2039631 RepID=A0ABS1JH91_9BURK|nr:multicopper oxidase domain-containing protein [Ramlibacter alkalitolerans]MBL0423589.1 multicopper oxidase domain-containing protein [Ramlibacter alkalitolerans]